MTAAPSVEPTASFETPSPVTSPDRAATAIAAAATQPAGPGEQPLDWRTLLLIVWATGAGVALLRLASGLVVARWVAARASVVTDQTWRHLAHDLGDQLGLTRTVQLLRSERAIVPMTWGWLRPVVLLPADADDWTTERRTVVLAHELAHVQRRDCATQALAQVACAMYWFNPLAWIAAKQLRVERERACDDQVLQIGTRPSDYATHLLDLARTQPMEWAAATTMAMARAFQLEGRVAAILDPKIKRGRTRTRALLAAFAILTLVVSLSSISPVATAAAEAGNGAPFAANISEDGSASDAGASAASATDARDTLMDASQPDAAASEDDAEAEDEDAEQRARPNPAVIAGLIRALDDEDDDVREAAARSLSRIRSPEVTAALMAKLDDPEPQIRETIVRALGRGRSAEAGQGLQAALTDANAGVRQQAAWALGNTRNREAVPALLTSLTDTENNVREQSAWALGQLRSSEAVAGLSAALSADDTPNVREQAAWALGQVRDQSSVDGLVAALSDADAGVREQVAWGARADPHGGGNSGTDVGAR